MTERITDEQLDEWEKLANEAEPGPWRADEGRAYDEYHGVREQPHGSIVCGFGDSDVLLGNAQFVAASREAVPALIAEVRRFREEHTNMSDALKAYITGHELALMRSEALGKARTQAETQKLRDEISRLRGGRKRREDDGVV